MTFKFVFIVFYHLFPDPCPPEPSAPSPPPGTAWIPLFPVAELPLRRYVYVVNPVPMKQSCGPSGLLVLYGRLPGGFSAACPYRARTREGEIANHKWGKKWALGGPNFLFENEVLWDPLRRGLFHWRTELAVVLVFVYLVRWRVS